MKERWLRGMNHDCIANVALGQLRASIFRVLQAGTAIPGHELEGTLPTKTLSNVTNGNVVSKVVLA